MEKYIVSARKYRPSSFKTIVGQHALSNTLKNAVLTGRLAQSYLFCGQRGVGKTTTARIFAKAINCENLSADGEPCNQCESCKAFNEQRSLNIVELDAASNNSVDDIRELTDQVRIPPISGKYRVFIIDEVHMLSVQAFNAFLKTLEEPPSYVIFILATTEKQKILPTILSRCQKYDFQSITVADIVEQLQYIVHEEGYTAEPAALNVIAQKADGAMRDALSIFDQVVAASRGNVTYQATIDNLNLLDYDYYFRLVDFFLQGNVEQSLLLYKEVRDHGFDSKLFINGLASHLRELLVARTPETASLVEVTADVAERYREQMSRCKLGAIFNAMELCNTCDLTYKDSSNKQFLVELTLIKICQLFGGGAPVNPGGGGRPVEKLQNNAPQSSAQPVRTATPAPSAGTPRAAVQNSVKPQPSPAPAATSGGGYKITDLSNKKLVGVPSISIKKSLEESSKKHHVQEVVKEEKATVVSAVRKNDYSYEKFTDAWREFVISHPDEIILTNAMKVAFPQAVGENLYRFTVENQAQVEVYERKKRELLSFIRDFLQNDLVQLEVVVREMGEREKLWTQRELLADVLENNPKASAFIKKYRLNLA